MAIIAKSQANDYVPAPAGTHAAVCVDVVDLGMLEVSFGGKNKKQHKIQLIWQIAEVKADNKPYLVRKRYTCSLHEKASLRKDLESWRGKPFTPEELSGFDLEVLLGIPALLNVVHAAGRDGGTFANVAAIMRLPKTMEAPTPRDYVRVIDRQPEEGVAQPEDWSAGITDDDVPFMRYDVPCL